ncbi:S-layer homology domain-containing protein [Phormidesmis priestleyi]|uniref:S-layer homology domain-containing protein n=1 Tax=Phormidesmis priestleyi TaxID=268141 RepID=UPI00083ADCAC|nr:S-layer homology domain-containing protein [Phormidesmis priestleyi]
MTASPEPPPSRKKLDTDELIAILVAFGSIGTIFFWAIGQSDSGFDLSSMSGGLIPRPAPVPSPLTTIAPRVNSSITAVPAPQATLSPSPEGFTSDPVISVVPVPLPAQPFSTPAPSPEVIAFSDVPPTYWAAPYIIALTQRGVLGGFPGGTFQPDKPVTRAEFAGIVSKAFDQAPTQPSLQFEDIAPTYWANAAIEKSVQTGFMNGYPGEVFRPDQPILLSQLQVALITGLNLPTPANPEQVVGKYADAQEVPKWAVDKVAAAIESGLVTNYPDSNKLNPNRSATRADAAALVYEALAKQGKVKQIQK